MLPSVVPRLTTDSAVRVFPGVWKLLSFLRLPSQDGDITIILFLFLFLSFLNYFLFLTFAQHSNVLLMNLLGRKWSPRPIPQPSEDCLPNTENLNDLSEKAEIWAQVNWTHEKGNGNPFQYSCLENSMDRGVWWAKVHGLTKSQTWLTNTLTFLTGSSTWQPLVLPF